MPTSIRYFNVRRRFRRHNHLSDLLHLVTQLRCYLNARWVSTQSGRYSSRHFYGLMVPVQIFPIPGQPENTSEMDRWELGLLAPFTQPPPPPMLLLLFFPGFISPHSLSATSVLARLKDQTHN